MNVKEGGHSAYEAVKQEYANTTSIEGKETCLSALGHVQTADLVNDFMTLQFSDRVAIQDTHVGSIALGANPTARDALWRWIKAHWDTVTLKLAGNSVVLDRYVKKSLEKFASHEVEQDIARFFEGKNNKGYDRGLAQVADAVQTNANYKERDERGLLEWLQAHGYV